MAMTLRCALALLCLAAGVATGAQNDGDAPPRYRMTDQVLEIEQGTTMFGLVWEFYPEYKNGWLDVAADLAKANPHAFRNGDPGDVIVGEQLTLIEYPDADATARAEAQAAMTAKPEPATATPAGASEDPPVAQPATASAATPIGRITHLDGAVRAVSAAQQTRTLALNDEVQNGDTLLTAPDARLTLTMIDEARLELHDGTHMVLEEYTFDEAARRYHSTITLLQGGLRIVTGAIASADPEAVFFNTPMATIGAQSADFGLRICTSGACRIEDADRPLLAGLYAGVLEGELAIVNNTGSRGLTAGEFVRVRNADAEPDPAVEAAPALFDARLLVGLDIKRDEPLGFWAWLRERFF